MLVVGKLPTLPPDHGWKLEDGAWYLIYLGERREELFDGARLAQGRFAVFTTLGRRLANPVTIERTVE